MRLSVATWTLAAIAIAASLLAHFDPWHERGELGGFVSHRSAAKRVFPQMAEHGPESAEIVLEPSAGPTVRLVPTADGHRLLVDDVDVGPVDPDALDGLWSSLRMATTLRAVPGDTSVAAARRGKITVTIGDRPLVVTVGGGTPDGVGLYGTVETGADPEVWVVESELGQILDQHPRAWLARRAVVVQPTEVSRLRFSDLGLERGADGLWRSDLDGRQALLDTDAVDTRLDRIAGARLDPMLVPGEHPGVVDRDSAPWLEIEATHGRTWTLHLGGPCPGHPGKRVLSRGPGWAGCIDVALTAAWPVPGRDTEDAGRLVENRLAPHPVGRVLAVKQSSPENSTLRRSAGDWVLEGGDDLPRGSTEVPAAEVYRWYQALHEAEVVAEPATATSFPIHVDLSIETDTTRAMRLRCGRDGDDWLCRRDDGPTLRVREPALRIGFDRTTFAERSLVDLPVGEARALEILPGPGSETVRQSAHLDLGAWRLDAPRHPDGDEALSEVALEELLAAFSGARAESWVATPSTEASRIIRVERTPRRGARTELVLRLHPGCIATVEGRAARLSDGTCEALAGDLLHTDPIDYWLQTARTVEMERDDVRVRLRRDDETWRRDDGQPVGEDVRSQLQELSELRASTLRVGEPATPMRLRLRILPRSGPAFVVLAGDGWAKIEDADWHYVLAPPEN